MREMSVSVSYAQGNESFSSHVFLRARLALACASSKGKQLRGEVERQVTHVQRYFLLSAICLDSYLC